MRMEQNSNLQALVAPALQDPPVQDHSYHLQEAFATSERVSQLLRLCPEPLCGGERFRFCCLGHLVATASTAHRPVLGEVVEEIDEAVPAVRRTYELRKRQVWHAGAVVVRGAVSTGE